VADFGISRLPLLGRQVKIPWERSLGANPDHPMPEWLAGLLQGLAKEGPAYAILLGAGVLLFRHLANQHKEHLASLDAKQKDELDRIVGVFE
jgi:hypothetical protein